MTEGLQPSKIRLLGYGVFLTYNLTAANTATYISAFTTKLYGSAAVYKP